MQYVPRRHDFTPASHSTARTVALRELQSRFRKAPAERYGTFSCAAPEDARQISWKPALASEVRGVLFPIPRVLSNSWSQGMTSKVTIGQPRELRPVVEGCTSPAIAEDMEP